MKQSVSDVSETLGSAGLTQGSMGSGFTVVVGMPLSRSGVMSPLDSYMGGPLLLIEAESATVQSVQQHLSQFVEAADHPVVDIQVVVSAIADGSHSSQWYQYNDSRLNGPIDLLQWSVVFPNAKLLNTRSQDYQTLEAVLSHWLKGWSTEAAQSLLGQGQLFLRQGDPMAILREGGDWLAAFNHVKIEVPAVHQIWAEDLKAFFQDKGSWHEDRSSLSWIRDAVNPMANAVNSSKSKLNVLLEKLSNPLNLSSSDTSSPGEGSEQLHRNELSDSFDQLAEEKKQSAGQKEILELKSQLSDITHDLEETRLSRDQLSESHKKLSKSHKELIKKHQLLLSGSEDLSNLLKLVNKEKEQLIKIQQDHQRQLNGTSKERDGLRAHRDELVISQQQLIARRDLLLAERDELRSQLSAAGQERQKLTDMLENLGIQQNQTLENLNSLRFHRDQLAISQQELIAERDHLLAENARLEDIQVDLTRMTEQSDKHLTYIKDLFVQMTTGKSVGS